MILVLYTSLFIPFSVCFIDEIASWYMGIDIFVDFCYFIDIILTFFSATESGHGKYETNKSVLAKNYLKGWFITDVLSSIPYQLIEKLVNHNVGLNSTKLLRIARIGRMGKLFRILALFKVVRIMK